MRKKLNSIRVRHKTIIYFVILVLALVGVTPVLADYLGPNRTVTETTSVCKVNLYECQYVPSKGTYKYKVVDSWACSNESKPWKAYSNEPSSQGCYDGTAGDTYWAREEILQEVTTTYPPATISSTLQSCTLSNGWCTTAPHVSLSGNEPVSGYNIIALEGSLNGQTFACANASCDVTLSEGTNSISYWALSSFGDSSTMGTLTAKVDSQAPNISGTLSGTSGSNGWYLSSVSFTASATDVTSGLASFTCKMDGIALASCRSFVINGEGQHTLVLTATDNAGNIRTLTRNASLDTQNPSLTAGLTGTLGSNSWYTAATLNATASDPTPGSGITTFEYELDNGGWISFPGSGELTLSDGKHTVDLRAVDAAGHTTSSSKSFWLDSLAPTVMLSPTGTMGSNNWYVSDLNLDASASDATSRLDTFEYSLDNNSWTGYSVPLTLTDGSHSVSFWAQDGAGLVTQVDRVYQVDTQAPQIAGSISGISGSNGWYTSDVNLSASASDSTPGSGLDTFTYILDNDAVISYTVPLNLSDGQHTVKLTAQDQAGLTYSIAQNINVDTIHPSLTITTTLPNWNKGSLLFNGTASDDGSGLSKIEISNDNGNTWQVATGTSSWSYDWNTTTSDDGNYSVRVRATDQAGLTTEKTLNVGLDNHAPTISVPSSWFQWDTVIVDVWDHQSGVSEATIEISDPDGHLPKRVITLDLQDFPLSFKWDRRMGDGTLAPSGDYQVMITATDGMGNTTQQNASIQVLLSILPAGPTSTPQFYIRPQATATPVYTSIPVSSPTVTPTAVISMFGKLEPTAQDTATVIPPPAPRATPTQTGVVDWLKSIFAPEANATEQVTEIQSTDLQSAESRTEDSQSNILWGATAAAMVGAVTAYAAEERRKQQEEKIRQAMQEAQEEQRHAKIQARHLEKIEEQHRQEAAWEEARSEQEQIEQARQQRESDRTERKEASVQKEINSYFAKPQEWKSSYDAYMAKKKEEQLEERRAAYYNAINQEEESAQPQEKSWWEKGLDWIDSNQTEVALTLGIVVGVGAIILSGGVATPLVAAAWVAGATAAAVTVTAGGTVALNKYYGRDWNENLLANVTVAGIGAFAVTAGWFIYQAGTTTLGAYCVTNPNICSRVEPVFKAIDATEEFTISAKMAYYKWQGDEEKVMELTFDLQSEYLDGDMPGNSISRELREELEELGEDAVDLARKHGASVVPFFAKYGDNGLEIIQKYGDNGFELIQKYGDDAILALQKYDDDTFDLITEHGIENLNKLKFVDALASEKLLKTLDDDVLDYAVLQGDDAVQALSRWSEDDLREHGIELALRANKDAQVLSDVRKLTSLKPIDPSNLTQDQKELIESIAANSTQYADEGQVVLGKWIDISNGFVERANDTGSVHYNPHPDMWNLLGDLGQDKQGEVAWLINQQVVKNGINEALPFEYTLNGVPIEELENEQKAIRAIFAGKTDTEILRVLEKKVMPIRIKELKELQEAGYEFVFDEVNNCYIFTLP